METAMNYLPESLVSKHVVTLQARNTCAAVVITT